MVHHSPYSNPIIDYGDDGDSGYDDNVEYSDADDDDNMSNYLAITDESYNITPDSHRINRIIG